jgi:hypothetical protein
MKARLETNTVTEMINDNWKPFQEWVKKEKHYACADGIELIKLWYEYWGYGRIS